MDTITCPQCSNSTKDGPGFDVIEDVTGYRSLDMSGDVPVAGPLEYDDGENVRLQCKNCHHQMPTPEWLIELDWEWK